MRAHNSPNDPAGPTAPMVGMQAAVTAAERDKLSPAETAQILPAYRAGDPQARQRLIAGHLYLVFRAAQGKILSRRVATLDPPKIPYPLGIREDLISTLYIALVEAIDGLPADTRDVERHVTYQMWEKLCDYHRKIVSPNLLMPRSSKSDAKKAGDPEPDKSLHREYLDFDARPSGTDHTAPTDLADDYSAIEWEILRLRLARYSQRQIAERLGKSRYYVRQILETLRNKAHR